MMHVWQGLVDAEHINPPIDSRLIQLLTCLIKLTAAGSIPTLALSIDRVIDQSQTRDNTYCGKLYGSNRYR